MPRQRLTPQELKEFLDEKAERFNNPAFIERDPVSIPHQFSRKEDIEIAGFFAAMLAWGQRVTIINKCNELIQLMDNEPYQFVMEHKPRDLNRLSTFRHRTFNPEDAVYFMQSLRNIYQNHGGLENAFSLPAHFVDTEDALIRFHQIFFSIPHPARTKKHVSTPERKSTCKRLSMYLRWMVRKDKNGVDFGLWNTVLPAQLVCPCDLHVDRVGRKLRLIRRKQTDWLTAVELTNNLRKLDPTDPVRYDFALFGLGIDEGWSRS